MHLLKFSRRHGLTIFWFSLPCTLLTAITLDVLGTVVGLSVCLCGYLEGWAFRHHPHQPKRAFRQAALAELALFGFISFYCTLQFLTLDISKLLSNPAFGATFSYLSAADMAQLTCRIQRIMEFFYLSLIGISLLYQGGLAWIYWTKSSTVSLKGPKD